MIRVNYAWEGSDKDFVDVDIEGIGLMRDVPYFGPDGEVISYAKALEVYGTPGLEQDIWEDEKYLSLVEAFLSTREA